MKNAVIRLHTHPCVNHPNLINWLLWVEEDGESDGRGRLYAGRVKLDMDPIATAHGVLHDAAEKLEITLGRDRTEPLF